MVMIIILIGVLGVIFGSFVNALVWRLHEREKLAGRKSKQAIQRRKELSIMRGRSMCTHCNHELAPRDLVPVLSWVMLHGKCRYCRSVVSWQYPIVELLTGVIFVVSYIAWPLSFSGVGLFQFVLWLAFLVGFMALAIYDIRWFLLPDRIVLPLTLLAVLQVVVTAIWQRNFNSFWEPIVAAVIIFGLFWILFQVSKGAWIGGGDVKLAGLLGLLAATSLKAFLVIFFASLIGTLVSIPLLLRGKQGLKLHVPFGPYLLTATVTVVLYGTPMIRWYQNLLLH